MIGLSKIIIFSLIGVAVGVSLLLLFVNPKDQTDPVVSEETESFVLGELDEEGGVIEDENLRIKALEGFLKEKVSFSYIVRSEGLGDFEIVPSDPDSIKEPLIITIKYYGDNLTQRQKSLLVPLSKDGSKYEETMVIGRDYEEDSITFVGEGIYRFVLLENHDKE